MSEYRLSFQEFCELSEYYVNKHLPEKYKDAEVSLATTTKNNDRKCMGLRITLPEDSEFGFPPISPIVYLEDFYEDYTSGKDGVADKILQKVEKTLNDMESDFIPGFDFALLGDYEAAKPHITMTLTNAEYNKEYLKDCPTRLIDDLVVSYKLMMGGDLGENYSAQITYGVMKDFGVTETELYEAALENMDTLAPGKFATLTGMLTGIQEDAFAHERPLYPEKEIYVLSNGAGAYGASVILDEKFMDRVRDYLGFDGVYVLPSSVHELLLVPKNFGDGDITLDTLTGMVRDVNSTDAVSPADKLSDNVYAYDFASHELYLAANEHLRNQTKSVTSEKGRSSVKEKLAGKQAEVDAAKKETPQKAAMRTKEAVI